eukprot:1153092-Pelagomonas_calceolata.AAC.2
MLASQLRGGPQPSLRPHPSRHTRPVVTAQSKSADVSRMVGSVQEAVASVQVRWNVCSRVRFGEVLRVRAATIYGCSFHIVAYELACLRMPHSKTIFYPVQMNG